MPSMTYSTFIVACARQAHCTQRRRPRIVQRLASLCVAAGIEKSQLLLWTNASANKDGSVWRGSRAKAAIANCFKLCINSECTFPLQSFIVASNFWGGHETVLHIEEAKRGNIAEVTISTPYSTTIQMPFGIILFS